MAMYKWSEFCHCSTFGNAVYPQRQNIQFGEMRISPNYGAHPSIHEYYSWLTCGENQMVNTSAGEVH